MKLLQQIIALTGFGQLSVSGGATIDNYNRNSFYDFYVDTIYPDVLRRDAKGQEYFVLPSQQELIRFGQDCIFHFVNYRWESAADCLAQLDYRVITVTLLDEIIYGAVPKREFGENETEDQIGHSRYGYFFLRLVDTI